MIHAMSEKSEPTVLGALPHSRPHRRSDKRAARPPEPVAAGDSKPRPGPKGPAKAAAQTRPARQPKKQAETKREPETTGGQDASTKCDATGGATELLTTAVQAAAELAEIGLSAGARALRIAISRLPHP
jgi:hypothetical protein